MHNSNNTHSHPFRLLAKLWPRMNKSPVIPFYFPQRSMAVPLSHNCGEMDAVKPRRNSPNFIKTLQAERGWWMEEGHQRQEALQKAHNRHPLHNICVNAANQALGKVFHSVYYILKNKEPCSAFPQLLHLQIQSSSAGGIHSAYCNFTTNTLPWKYTICLPIAVYSA